MERTETDIATALIGYITTELLGDQPGLQLAADEDLLGSELVDSLGVMRLVGFMERAFEISVPPQDVTIEHFGSVRAMSTYVAGRGT